MSSSPPNTKPPMPPDESADKLKDSTQTNFDFSPMPIPKASKPASMEPTLNKKDLAAKIPDKKPSDVTQTLAKSKTNADITWSEIKPGVPPVPPPTKANPTKNKTEPSKTQLPSVEISWSQNKPEIDTPVAESTQVFEHELLTKTTQLVVGDFWKRVLAFAIDLVFLFFLSSALIVITILYTPLPKSFYDLSTYLIFILTYLLLISLAYLNKTQSLGKFLFNLHIISFDDQEVSFRVFFLRETIGKAISFLCLYLGFIMAAFTKNKISLHDLIFRTRVKSKHIQKK